MAKQEGWIKLYRQLLEHESWLAEPFTRGQAWVDLLLLANHKDGYIRVRGLKIPVLRGQVGWSMLQLAKRWKWSRAKVKRFIQELQNEQQVEQQINLKISVLTIVNYDQYQSSEQQNEQQNEHQKDNRKATEKQQNDPKTDTSEANSEGDFDDSASNRKATEQNEDGPKTDTNKKIRNKEVKKRSYMEFVTLTEEEYQKLVEAYGQAATDDIIDELNNYKGSRGKKYKSDYFTIRQWMKRREKEARPHGPKVPPASLGLFDHLVER